MPEPYHWAEEEIEKALRNQTDSLDLNGASKVDALKLETIPESLSQLTHLRSLDLSNNKLVSLPQLLSRLTRLERLSLRSNALTTLPNFLSLLTELQSLDLAFNQLHSFPTWVGDLNHLVRLGLGYNRLSSLPEVIGRLRELDYLVLASNELTNLPPSVGELRNITWLDVSGNRLTSLPVELSKLSTLRTLFVDKNELRSIPAELGQLKSVKTLDLSDNHIVALPESFKGLTSLERLFLQGNRALDLPNEILGPTWEEVVNGGKKPTNPHAILAFYFSQRNQLAKPLNEVKLLLVGHGRVGKTSLSKALRGAAHDEQEPETPGIERNLLPLTVGKANITAHVWDFGGQEFLHQTHQFFFSERSIYVVVLTGRQGRPMQEAEYWLRLIRTYGTDSPVVIVLNQIKAHPFSVDEYYLQENYPEVKAVLKTDCHPRLGIEPLRRQLGKLAGAMPSVREKIDPSWARVRTRLEEMKASFVTFAAYREICVDEGVTTAEKQDTLATILDCLGIALNYRTDPRLRDTSVLKPRWLVDGIYSILRWLQKHETNGEMRLTDFPKALKSKRTYPPEMHKFLLSLMEKFELCFPLDAEGKVFLVPGLLSANQPRELRKFLGADSRKIQFRYEDVRPPGLLPRFIVRSHTLSERQARWQRGVVLARGTARALVRGDHEGRVTDVFALGDEAADRIWLTEFILSEMRILHDKLPVRTFVESDGVWPEFEVLREEALRPGGTRAERAADGTMVIIDAKQTLAEIESAEAGTPKKNPLSLFICYAHANERTVRQLIPSLKVLARRGYIEPWSDTNLVPGEDWDDTIKERSTEADIILFMVSRDFLASKYITEQERPLAMALMSEGKAVVVPVLLSPCSWRDEDFARLEKLPRKDDPISSFSPRDSAWFLVEEGLKKVVEQAVSKRKRLPNTARAR